MNQSYKNVGKSLPKVDGIALATGKAQFVLDYTPVQGMHYLKVLSSPHPHALIKDIETEEAKKIQGVKAVLTYKDAPRIAYTTAGQGYPEPSPYDAFILDKKVRYVGDRVAIVVAESPEIAQKAMEKIKVEYELLTPILESESALEKNAPSIHDEPEARIVIPVFYDPKNNIASKTEAVVGDIDKGFEQADEVIDSVYSNHYGQHTPMENHICLTYFDEKARLIIITSTQVPFHVRRIVAQAINFPLHRIRVIKPRIGGGFGCKQEVLIEPVCAFATLKTGSPVLYQMTRQEEFISSRTRHPQKIYLKTGIKKDGTLTAVKMDILMNSGSYGAHALTVSCNSGSKVLPLYKCDNISFEATSVYTNLPTGGAYRGYGATQAAFAMECQLDEMADKIGMDPLKLRQKLHIRSGETSPIFAALGEGKPGVEQFIGSCGLEDCIKLGAEAIGWEEKRKEYAKDKGRIRRGVGMAALMQGSSIPYIDMGAATIKMNEDGSFNLLVGATDIGTGSDTIFAQIAAEILGINYDKIIVYSSDTDFTPFDVGAYASSTTYLSGETVRKVALEVSRQIKEVAANILNEKPESFILSDGKVISMNTQKSVTLEKIGTYSLYENNQFQIGATSSHVTQKSPPPFSAHFGEIEIDTETGKIKIIKYIAAVDCGFAINPQLAEGQIEGAVANGLSYALTEQYLFDNNGRMTNPSLRYYKILNIKDLPDIKTILVSTCESTGPFGAKSVSEISINGPMPVISNAVKHATGVRLSHSPFTPYNVYKQLHK